MIHSVEAVILERAGRQEMEEAAQAGIRILVPESPDWPAELVDIPDAPQVLYVRGEIRPKEPRLAIVGTRIATAGGRRLATQFGRGLAAAGVTVVSGLARGIDTAAHQGALQAKGRTIAVLGTGLLNVYPPENAKLAEEIVRNGALVSEFPLHAEGMPAYFPQRNRIISGLSAGVIIVEAPKKSGALITADHALDQGREVMAVPGSPLAMQSAGGNLLIRDGAACVTSAEEALAVMKWAGPKCEKPIERPEPVLPPEERLAFETLSVKEPVRLEELSAASGLDVPRLLTTLSEWEMNGWVKHMPGNRYLKK